MYKLLNNLKILERSKIILKIRYYIVKELMGIKIIVKNKPINK
jgi:hypothetical protein